ncbi:MAG: hypothetical protein Q9208_007558 [Pyrenodesmia sp. 3 TL-2023]
MEAKGQQSDLGYKMRIRKCSVARARRGYYEPFVHKTTFLIVTGFIALGLIGLVDTDGAIAPQRTQDPPYAYKEPKNYAKPGLGPVSFHYLDARTVTPMPGKDSVPLSSDSLEQVTASPSPATPAALVFDGLEDDKSSFSSQHAPYAAYTTRMFAPAFELLARPVHMTHA